MHVGHNVAWADDPDELEGYAGRYFTVFKGNISDCLKYDQRRSWIPEELGL